MTRPRTSAAPQPRRRLLAVAAASLVAVLGASSCSASGDGAKEAGAGKGSATRTVTDIAGEVEVPAEPKRIVSVDFYSPATLVDLGVKPVGVVEGFDSDDPDLRPKRYHDALKDTPTIGMYYELNIEAVAQQNPDMIFAETRFLRKGELKRLQGIAPVVQLDAAGVGAWKERTLMIGAAIGKSAEIKKQAAVFEKRADELKTKYADVLADNKIAVFAYGQDKTTWGTYPAGHFYVPAWDAVGAKFRPYTEGEHKGQEGAVSEWLSLEQIGKLDNADILLHAYGAKDFVDETLADNTVWKNLPAVKNGMVFRNIPASVVSSFEWGTESLDALDGVLAQIDEKARS
ncbi:iron-siderophore ABC transporter substrate-binding protein [Streptomyces sp. Root63]|uniref:ABC transporter substrate-binding protein n=1 Tax=unclassified Streptomyces TaxID=2593676 RepID=UPI0006F6D3ED|nr:MULTISPECIES: ABC transporter substrate-binding protein [unclassified Streptomyces]KQX28949.1 iron-siderophore ABC transporter substrate-binding protein [Streptomyces sp. Root1295]KRA49998.1 iron-siderophore ABC transporter substrate-binding protein [Streptomyces sp. Root63]